MTKICYIIGQLSRHGAERQLYELVRRIDKEKFLPVVISLSQINPWAEEIRKTGVEVMVIPRKKKREAARLYRLWKLLRMLKPDIVHTYLIPGNFYGRVAAFLSGVPVIISSERNLPEIGKDKTRFRMCLDKVLSTVTDGIICNSYKASGILTGKYHFDRRKVFTVHNGIDAAEFIDTESAKNYLERKRVTIGTVGRLWPQKNHIMFLDVARAVVDRKGDERICFLIVGDGPLRKELEQYAKSAALSDSVVFAGERFDIPQVLREIDVFVMTSSYEGLSNTVMEAMLSGLPVVATDVGGNGELVVDGLTGYLCPWNDPSAMSDKIMGLIGDRDKMKRMGEHGREKMLKEFSVEKMVRRTEDIYSELLSRKMKVRDLKFDAVTRS